MGRLTTSVCVAIALGLSTLSSQASAQSYVEGFETTTTPALPAGWVTAGPNVWKTSNANARSGTQNLEMDAAVDYSRSTVTLPVLTANGSAATFSFNRLMPSVEDDCDGLRLFVSINSGPFVDAATAGGAFSAGGYDDNLVCLYPDASFAGPAWTNRQSVYTASTYDLPALAAGTTVQFQLQFLMDSSFPSSIISVDDVSATNLFLSAPGPATVPTMSEWAIILLGAILAGGAALYVQRRRQFV